MKKCYTCGLEKELEQFYRHPRMADGHLKKCKICFNRDGSHKNGKVIRPCSICIIPFRTNITEVKRASGKYCSKKCFYVRLNKVAKKFLPGQVSWNKGKKLPQITGEKHHHWKGNRVSYIGLHRWVERHRGRPSRCEHCGRDDLTGKHIQWANKSRKYLRDLNDWIRLCVPCDRKYDKNSPYDPDLLRRGHARPVAAYEERAKRV